MARTEGIEAVDLDTNQLTPALVAAQHGHAALAIPGSREVISTNGNSDTATIFDGVSGAIRAVIATGKKPDDVAYDPVTKTLWVMNADGGDISVIDPAAAKVIATIAVGGSLELGVADGEGRMFVNVEDHNDVAVLDTRSRTLIKRFPLKGCDGPTGIAYDPDDKWIVSACANGRAIISTRDGRRIASITIGRNPDGALFDRSRHVALIPSGGSGTLAVIDMRGDPHLIDTVATAKSARTAAIDPVTGRVYLSAASFAPPVGKERAKMIPGSYRVLVLEPTSGSRRR